MATRGVQLFQFSNSNPVVRTVAWERLPLGAIVIDWPTVNDSPIPELRAYPRITRTLRNELGRKYQFLRTTTVTIVDPSLGLEPAEVAHTVHTAARLQDGLQRLDDYRSRVRSDWRGNADAVRSLAGSTRYDEGPYTLLRSWVRSVSTTIRSTTPFGANVWGAGIAEVPLVTLVARMLSEEIRVPEPQDTLVDVGVDVSYSMRTTGKAVLAWNGMAELLWFLGARLGTSTWRAWLVSDRAAAVDWKQATKLSSSAGEGESGFDVLLRALGIHSGDTNFAPFFREVVNTREMCRRHLCILITDGMCRDRAATLRLAERLRSWGTDYLQLVLHREDDLRHRVRTASSEAVLDGYLHPDAHGSEGDEFDLPKSELEQLSTRRLREVTDIAEAAHGGQLVLNWMPLLGYVSIDVYERWLGEIVASL